MSLSINSWVHIQNDSVAKNGDVVSGEKNLEPQALYKLQSHAYMKFFKMDILSKWAWLGAELLLNSKDKPLYENIDPTKVAVVLMTSRGCIDVDKKYKASMTEIPSPALFVYTLPNIMLGEICIRHGFKGEQLCLVSENFDSEQIAFWVNDLLTNRGMEACLCGYVDAYSDNKDVMLYWVDKSEGQSAFTTQELDNLYNQ